MIHEFFLVLEIVSVAGILASIGYYSLCLYGAARFLGERKAADRSVRPTPSALPPISILKPLKGTDPEMYESFRSHCLQKYPGYEIIFGVSEANDPAIEFVERLQREFPQIPIRTVLCLRNLGANIKVSNLAQMMTEAQYDHIVVNDSDIRVEPDYLEQVVGPLVDPQVGWEALAGLAPPDLFQRGRRSDPLHLAGKSRPEEAAGICLRAGGFDGQSVRRLDRIAKRRRDKGRSIGVTSLFLATAVPAKRKRLSHLP